MPNEDQKKGTHKKQFQSRNRVFDRLAIPRHVEPTALGTEHRRRQPVTERGIAVVRITRRLLASRA
jgi:hypothetical protein